MRKTERLILAKLILVCKLMWVTTTIHAQPCDYDPDHFSFAGNTGDSYAIILDSLTAGCDLSECDEIGVFDGELCVGASVYRGIWPLPLTAWKDNPQTSEIDGYACGNQIAFRLWQNEVNKEITNLTVHLVNGNMAFCSGAYARLWLDCPCDCDLYGDLNIDGLINPVDVVYIINYVYKNSDARLQIPSCPGDNGDLDCSGVIDAVDVVYLLNYVYKNQDERCDPCDCDPYPDFCPPYP